MENDGSFGAQAPVATAPTPKSPPGEGLKKFLASGALDALLAPGSFSAPVIPEEPQANLMDFLRLTQGQM